MDATSHAEKIGASIVGVVGVYIAAYASLQAHWLFGLVALIACAFAAGAIIGSWWCPALLGLAPVGVAVAVAVSAPPASSENLDAFVAAMVVIILIVVGMLSAMGGAAGVIASDA